MQNATDARTLTQTEHDLIRSIADNIVENEVMKPMEAIGWEHGTPPTRAMLTPEDNPTETANQPTEPHKTEVTADNPTVSAETPKETPVPTTSSINWEDYRDANGLILGKYKNEIEAVKGVSHAVAMAKNALTRAAEVEAENQRLRQQMISQPTPVSQSPAPTAANTEIPTGRLDEVLERIGRDGLDEMNARDLRDVLRETAETTAAAVVERTLKQKQDAENAEAAKWREVDNHMSVKYPDSLRYTNEIALFIKTNPIVDAAVGSMIAAGREKEAAELAWIQFQAEQNASTMATTTAEAAQKTIQLEAADQVRREAVEQARKDAGVSTTIAAGVHETPAVSTSREELDRAAAEMRATGLGEKWRSLAFAEHLKHPIFNQ